VKSAKLMKSHQLLIGQHYIFGNQDSLIILPIEDIL
jgi:hypothetical protein